MSSAAIAHDWVRFHARRTPAEVALVNADSGEQWTWSRLDDRVGRLARGLYEVAGVRRGERVAVLAETHPRVLEIQFACFRLGAIFVPLNWRLPVPELVYICEDATPGFLVHDDVWRDVAVATATEAGVRTVLDVDALETMIADHDYLAPGRDNTLDTSCQLLYTSGTTGFPKGAISTFGTMTWNMMNGVKPKALTALGVNVYNPLPLFHAGGLNSTVNPALMNGARVTTASRFDAAAALAVMTRRDHPATHVAAVPIMYHRIATLPEFEEADLSAIRVAVCAGGAADANLVRAFAAKGVQLEAHYGGTELGPACLALSPPDQKLMEAGSVGRPVQYSAVRVVDEVGDDVEVGTVGEIWVKGPSVTPGYWNRDNSEFFEDGWFKTGDLARIDGDGYYYLADRAKDMYKSGGENVYPAEVERLILDSELVAEVAVIGVPDPEWGEVGLAVVVAAGESKPTLDHIHDTIGERLARFKLPKAVALVDELPRNVTGKVSKVELRERFARSEASASR